MSSDLRPTLLVFADSLAVPGDASSAAFLVAGAVMALGGLVTLRVPKVVGTETASETARRPDV